ncbi:hypothetical protein HG531_006298 [Fusarium graminearum]|nr:hypothetical protein HG531_006298 [Fusarium graminearum]
MNCGSVAVNLDTFPQTLNLELLASGAAVDILDIVCVCLKVAGSIVALGDEDVVLGTILKRVTYHELLLDLAKALQTSLELDMVLGRVGIVGASERVLEDADGSENVSNNLGLVGEVRGVTEDHLGLGLELHLLDTGHGSLDANSLVAIVLDLVDVGVKHVSATVDGRQAGKTLGKLAEAVERVNVRRLSVSSNRVSVETDAIDSLGSLARGGDVVVGEVESHGVADEVLGGCLEAELVVDILHCALVHVKA